MYLLVCALPQSDTPAADQLGMKVVALLMVAAVYGNLWRGLLLRHHSEEY
jgi:hypothetical protein